MSTCPHCFVYYDEGNESQPCCGMCGHPITCECELHGPKVIHDSDVPFYAEEDDWASVFNLVRSGANIDGQESEDGYTALHYAAHSGNKNAVSMLIELGANINKACDGGASAIFFALGNGHIEIVELLIRHNADVNLKGGSGETPIFKVQDNQEIAKILVNAGADLTIISNVDKCTVIHTASRFGNKYLVERILKSDHSDIINSQDSMGYTPLHFASGTGEIIIVKLLMEAGAEIEAKNLLGDTPLIEAARLVGSEGKVDIIQYLLEAGANVHTKTRYGGDTLLHLAAGTGTSPFMAPAIHILLNAGADINAINEDGENPLQKAIETNRKEAIKALTEAGASI